MLVSVHTCPIRIIRQNQSSTESESESESESLSLNFFKKLSPIIIYALAWHIARDTPLLANMKMSLDHTLDFIYYIIMHEVKRSSG